MSAPQSNPDVLPLVAGIVSAHVAHNAVTAEALPGLIQTVYATLNGLTAEAPAAEKSEPAVPVEKSVFPNYLICLEDGKKLTMLKRHLSTVHGLTPEQYRERWGLPRNYPVVAPKYAARRSVLAKEIGLGRKPAASDGRSSPPIQRVAEGVRGLRATRKGGA